MSRTNLVNVKSRVVIRDGIHYFEYPSKTDQSFKKDCDINLMVKRFTKANRMDTSKFMSYMATIAPSYVTDGVVDGYVPDLQEHLNNACQADEMFMSLPSALRAKFDNDSVQFLNFVINSKNRSDLADLGLLSPEAVKRLQESSEAAKAADLASKAGSSSPA